jgi:hypothetical protein
LSRDAQLSRDLGLRDSLPQQLFHQIAPPGGIECSFRGTFLEIDPPTRSVQAWLFDGWPDAEAVETMDLCDAGGGVTVLT